MALENDFRHACDYSKSISLHKVNRWPEILLTSVHCKTYLHDLKVNKTYIIKVVDKHGTKESEI